MAASSVRTVLPLSMVTGASMLAMDLYLPAVPTLQRSFGVGVSSAQATVALFLAGLAASQLLWAEALARVGPRRSIQLGVGLLAAGSVGCAVAPTIELLAFMRLLQGVAAGAATVVAPTVVRATLSDADAVRGIAAISMIEALVPAAGPVLGAALLLQVGWRGLFWALGALTLLVLPFAVRVTPRELPDLDRGVDARYRRLLSNGRFLKLALSHALAMGALLTFVASAPHLMVNALGRGSSSFAALQLLGVAAFIALASQSARISARLGPARTVKLGAALQAALSAALLVASVLVAVPFAMVVVFWCGFCGALAVRGPTTFSEALAVPPAQMGRASALLVLALLLAGAVGTQGVAPFMDGRSVAPLAAGVFVMSAVSLGLVARYPERRS